ncbi:Lipoprotein [Salinibacterium sp. NYA9b]
MRQPNLLRLSIGALLLATLSGCVPSDASTAPAPTSTFVAPYATDEEALAAAEEAYAEYLRVINFHLNESVIDEDLLATVAVGDEYAGLVESHTRLAEAGTRSVGEVKFDDAKLQRYSTDGSLHELLVVYVCEDLSDVYLVNPDGTRVTEEAFSTELAQITFDYSESVNSLLVSDREPWGEKC